jgi:uncharacterized membrane protein
MMSASRRAPWRREGFFLPLLWLVVIAVAAYIAFALVAGAMKVVVIVAAVAAAIWVLSRLRARA